MFKVYVFIMLIGLIWISQVADAKPKIPATRPHSVAPFMNSRYADIIIEPNSGRILHETNATSFRHPASLTKMMTLYLTFKALKNSQLKLDQPLTVSINAANQGPTKLGLKEGETITVRNAIMSMVTLSANDSAVVLAEALGGNEADFGKAMTEQAASLGMKQSHFYNSSGLPNPNQITTAYDMAILGLALLREFPQYYPFFSLNDFSYDGVQYHNHNHLMETYPGMDGIKTGYIATSGFNLVASAKQGQTRLIGVVFGGSSPASRNQRMAQLLDQGFAMLAQVNTQQPQQNLALFNDNLIVKYPICPCQKWGGVE